MKQYVRPLVQFGPARPDSALQLAAGAGWFTHVEVLARDAAAQVIAADAAPADAIEALTAPRSDIAGLSVRARPLIMGILNATPDSFSDGGLYADAVPAVGAAQAMLQAGADIIDIGGESTRPGAQTVPTDQEIARVRPVIEGLEAANTRAALSIDTRKAAVAEVALSAGASIINDVSGLTYDAAMLPLAARTGVPVCVMHAAGDPETMQDDPRYADVLLDVYDFLEARIATLTAAGIDKARIIADPGIGFGKTLEHNLALLVRLSLFHSLGVPILLGVSRKGFIGKLSGVTDARQRAPGSIGAALAALGQGVQMLRVHDVAETRQAVTLWQAGLTGNPGLSHPLGQN